MPATSDDLHTHAIEAEKHLEQLATGIASVGADDATVKGIAKMADMCRQIAVGLAKGGTQPQPQQPTTDQAIAAHMDKRRAEAAAAAPQPY